MKIKCENLWYTNYHPHLQQDNLDLAESSTQDAMLEELKFFRSNGGDSIVEVTTFGKNLEKLAELSRKSGVQIVGNTGFYVEQAFSQSIKEKSIENLYDIMLDELLNGINGFKPGLIGDSA